MRMSAGQGTPSEDQCARQWKGVQRARSYSRPAIQARRKNHAWPCGTNELIRNNHVSSKCEMCGFVKKISRRYFFSLAPPFWFYSECYKEFECVLSFTSLDSLPSRYKHTASAEVHFSQRCTTDHRVTLSKSKHRWSYFTVELFLTYQFSSKFYLNYFSAFWYYWKPKASEFCVIEWEILLSISW